MQLNMDGYWDLILSHPEALGEPAASINRNYQVKIGTNALCIALPEHQ